MMSAMAPLLHRAIDVLAMWTEDRHARAAMAFREASSAPLDCFGPLPELRLAPPREGPWRAPSPRPAEGDATMAVHAFAARGVRRGTVVPVPPWKVPRLGVVEGYVRLLARAGYDVWTLVPPRHLQRALPGARNGEGFVSPDLVALRGAFEQLVLEIRALAALARGGGGEVGVLGLSLGALGAALGDRAQPLDFAALVAPPADLAVFSETAIGRRRRPRAPAGAPPPPPDALSGMLRRSARTSPRPRRASSSRSSGSASRSAGRARARRCLEGDRAGLLRAATLTLLFAAAHCGETSPASSPGRADGERLPRGRVVARGLHRVEELGGRRRRGPPARTSASRRATARDRPSRR